jgi:hypothetical protein
VAAESQMIHTDGDKLCFLPLKKNLLQTGIIIILFWKNTTTEIENLFGEK